MKGSHMFMLNKGETGEGVGAGKAGLHIDRGSQEPYNIIYDETDQRFKVGVVGSEKTVLTMDDLAFIEAKMKPATSSTMKLPEFYPNTLVFADQSKKLSSMKLGNGQLLMGLTDGFMGVSMQGTKNQIECRVNNGMIKFSTSQDLAYESAPKFSSLALLNDKAQLALGPESKQVIIDCCVSANRTYKLPDYGVDSQFAMQVGPTNRNISYESVVDLDKSNLMTADAMAAGIVSSDGGIKLALDSGSNISAHPVLNAFNTKGSVFKVLLINSGVEGEDIDVEGGDKTILHCDMTIPSRQSRYMHFVCTRAGEYLVY